MKNSHSDFRASKQLNVLYELSADTLVLPQDDGELLVASGSPAQRRVMKRPAVLRTGSQEQHQSPAQMYTEEALNELFRHVNHNMPDSAKKKKLVRQVLLGSTQLIWCNARVVCFISWNLLLLMQLVKETTVITPLGRHANKKHARSRSFGGIIKVRPVPGDAAFCLDILFNGALLTAQSSRRAADRRAAAQTHLPWRRHQENGERECLFSSSKMVACVTKSRLWCSVSDGATCMCRLPTK